MNFLESTKSAALLAGVFCYAMALTTIVLLPEFLTNASEPKVVGEDGVERDVRPYTREEAAGRETYGKQVCWHCHSQFVRPVNDEVARWGPVSQTGEYAFDLPHFFGTRRTGPDLHREGGLRPDDWHYAHFLDPRFTVPHSVMPAFTWLFYEQDGAARGREILELLDTDGDGQYAPALGLDLKQDPTDEVAKAREEAKSFDRYGLRPPYRRGDSDGPEEWRDTKDAPDGILTDYDLRPLPTPEAENLVAYVQRLGTPIGRWRKPIYVTAPTRASPFADADPRPRRTPGMRVYGFAAKMRDRVKAAKEATAAYERDLAAWNAKYPRLAERVARGDVLFQKNCSGCHGVEGRGNGTAAPTLMPRPRDFTVAKFKFRSTPVGKLPLDGDIYRSIFRGLPGSGMPTWKELSDEQIWLLVDYVKTLYERENAFNEVTWATIVQPPRLEPNPAKDLARGRALFLASGPQCFNCHGKEGRGNGPGWNTTTGDVGAPIAPRDLRPRIKEEWAPELWTLLARSCERLLGKEGWAKASARAEWKALEPSSPAKAKAFVVFLLGSGPRLFDVVGGEAAVKAAVGEDPFDRLFGKGRDALDEIRMAVATERDQPALRFRGGAAPEDVYRTIFTGIDGTQMKSTYDQFWKRILGDMAGRDDLSKRERTFLWSPVIGTKIPLSIVTGDPALREVGVTVGPDEKGVEKEWVTMQAGDDWALVRYVMWLACIPPPRAGD